MITSCKRNAHITVLSKDIKTNSWINAWIDAPAIKEKKNAFLKNSNVKKRYHLMKISVYYNVKKMSLLIQTRMSRVRAKQWNVNLNASTLNMNKMAKRIAQTMKLANFWIK